MPPRPKIITSELFFGQIVGDVNEAIDYINRFGSSHTDVIVSEDKELQDRFLPAAGKKLFISVCPF